MTKNINNLKTFTVLTPSEYILNISKDYAIYVCESRGIPRIQDGLKAAQRKAIWLMRNRTDKIKTVALSGAMIESELYLHGDASAQDTIGKLAAPYINNIPLIQGEGQFGTRIAPVEGIGAARYTYVKKGKAMESLVLPDIDIVPLVENHDGSNVEPAFFLPIIPLILINGISGIAVGWSTSAIRRDVYDVIDACIDALKGKKVKQLKPYYHRYDMDIKHIAGNQWSFSGKVEIPDASTIRVKELPIDMSLPQFKEKLDEMEDKDAIISYTDRSTSDIDIIIKMPRGSVKGWTVDQALKFLKLIQKKTEFITSVNWNLDGMTRFDTAEQVVEEFVQWRLNWYVKRYEKMLEDAVSRWNYLQAIIACFDAKVPEKINKLKNKGEVTSEVKKVTADYELEDSALDRIVSMPSYRWAKEYYDETLKKITEVETEITEYNDILESEERRKDIYISELQALRKIKFYDIK